MIAGRPGIANAVRIMRRSQRSLCFNLSAPFEVCMCHARRDEPSSVMTAIPQTARDVSITRELSCLQLSNASNVAVPKLMGMIIKNAWIPVIASTSSQAAVSGDTSCKAI